MAFFEDIGRNVSNVGQDLVKKSKDLQEANRIKTQTAKQEADIQNCYRELGKLCYENRGAYPNEKMQLLFRSITSAQKEIENLKAQNEGR